MLNYEDNRERILEHGHEYYTENRELNSSQNHEYYLSNGNDILDQRCRNYADSKQFVNDYVNYGRQRYFRKKLTSAISGSLIFLS